MFKVSSLNREGIPIPMKGGFMGIEHLILLGLIILIVFLIFRFTFKIVKHLAINTVVGLILVGLLNFLGIVKIKLTLINLLIIAVGGIIGVFIIILLKLIGLQ